MKAGSAADVVGEIYNERNRQINGEGFSPEWDDNYRNGELIAAACCYVWDSIPRKAAPDRIEAAIFRHRLWPWQQEWWKPTGRRSNLIKAAALIVAEIERLDRAAKKDAQP